MENLALKYSMKLSSLIDPKRDKQYSAFNTLKWKWMDVYGDFRQSLEKCIDATDFYG